MAPRIPQDRLREILGEAFTGVFRCEIPSDPRGVCEVRVWEEAEGVEERYRLAIRSITSDDRRAGEQQLRRRIQLTTLSDTNPTDIDALLGVADDEDGTVIVAVSPSLHLPAKGGSPSVQLPIGLVESVVTQDALVAMEKETNNELFLAFPPAELRHVLLETPTGQASLGKILSPAADRLKRTVQLNVRDRSFQTRVLGRDNYACAMCDIQLGVVDAAHILEHAASGDESTANGVGLCATHHAAYDRSGLIGIDGRGGVYVNMDRLRSLRSDNRDSGAGQLLLYGTKPRIAIHGASQSTRFDERFQRDSAEGDWQLLDRIGEGELLG